MAVTMQTESDRLVARVVDAVRFTHAARGSGAVEMPLLELVHASLAMDTSTLPGIVAVDDRVVELVVDDSPFEAIGPAIWALAARGWDVITLVAADRAGEAHRALRGTPCRLQPWWIDGGTVRFGAFEVP